MDKKDTEKQLIVALRESSSMAVGDDSFKDTLLGKILAQEKERGGFSLIFTVLNMQAKHYILIFLALVLSLSTGVGVGYLVGQSKDEPVANINVREIADNDYQTNGEELPIDPSGAAGDDTAGLRLATETVSTVTEAKAKVDFPLYLPTEKNSTESITNIEVSKNFEGGKSDSIFVTYSMNGKTIYKINAIKNGYMDEEGESIKVNGKNAKYIEFEEPDVIDPGLISEDYEPINSYVVWMIDGVRYDVSDYSGLTKAQLIAIAESFEKQ